MPKPIKSPTLQADRKPFAEFLATLDFGEVNKEATDALQDLVQACGDTGKAGKITITLAMKPIGRTGQVEVETNVVLKAPEAAKGKMILFVTPENNLQREHPKQSTLDGVLNADQHAEQAVQKAPDATPGQPLRAVG